MRLRHSKCTCTTASRGFGLRTTPTWSKGYARRDGRADASGHGSWCWLDSAADDGQCPWRRELAELTRPFSPGSDYVDQIGLETDEGSERIKAAYGANYERLVAVKNKYDPTNLFRHNQNIKPTVSANPAGGGGA
jgi:hypothetical protein